MILTNCQISNGQKLYNDSVHYSLPEYRLQRQWAMEAKASLITKERIIHRFRDIIVPTMDTTIVILRQRVAARDSLIVSKDQTIKSLSGLSGKAFYSPVPWITALGGFIVCLLLVR